MSRYKEQWADKVVFNVKDFGAVGNGVADDTAAIQAAITAAEAAGGQIYLPPGIYLISSALTLSAWGIVFRGAGAGATIIRQTADAKVISVAGTADKHLIANLEIQSHVDTTNAAIKVEAICSSGAIRDVVIRPNPALSPAKKFDTGICIDGSYLETIDTCYINETINYGISLLVNGASPPNANTILNCNVANTICGIYLENPESGCIIGGAVQGAGFTYGVHIKQTLATTCKFQIVGLHFEAEGASSTQLMVEDVRGLTVVGGSFDVTPSLYGIHVHNSVRVNLIGIYCHNNIYIENAASEVTFSGSELTLSKITDDASTKTQYISCYDYENANNFTGNIPTGVVTARGGLVSTTLSTPVNAAFTLGTGTLVAGDYYYRVSAVNGLGETLASTETSLTITAPQAPAGVNVNWGYVRGAIGYKVYGRTTGAELLMTTISGGTTLTWLDNGSLSPSGALPTINTTAKTTLRAPFCVSDSTTYTMLSGLAACVRGAKKVNGDFGGQLDLVDTTAYNSNPLSGVFFSSPYVIAGDATPMSGVGGGKENTTDGNYAGYLAFYSRANGATIAERVRVTSGGLVGIGTTGPDFKLDVSGDVRIEGANKLYFGGTGAADNDVNLYRSGANTLKTDDTLEIAGDIVGAVQTIKVPFAYNSPGGTVSSTATIPVGAVVTRTLVDVTTLFDGTTPKCVVTVDGSTPTTLQADTNNDLTAVAQYDLTTITSVGYAGAVKITLTLSGASQGVGVAYVQYVTPRT